MKNLSINEKSKDRHKSLKDSPGAHPKGGKLPSGESWKTSVPGSREKLSFGPPAEKR